MHCWLTRMDWACSWKERVLLACHTKQAFPNKRRKASNTLVLEWYLSWLSDKNANAEQSKDTQHIEENKVVCIHSTRCFFSSFFERIIKQNKRRIYDILWRRRLLSIELYLEKVLTQTIFVNNVVCWIFHNYHNIMTIFCAKWGKGDANMTICYYCLYWKRCNFWCGSLLNNFDVQRAKARDHSIQIDLWMKLMKNTLRKYTAFTFF